ncbi:MAG: galactose-1-epimerase, partial [Lachnospiraceae bacterium]
MITEKVFGQTQDGQTVTLYSIFNENGFQADVMNYGAILVNLFVPNKRGKVADVTLGYDNLKKYFTNSNFFGASVGPIANRTANAVF